MTDAVGDRPPRNARRGLVVGALALLATVALVVLSLRDAPADRPAPSPSPSTAAEAVPLQGPETREVTGRAVVVADSGEVSVVDLATGEAQPVTVGEPIQHAFRAGGSVVLVGAPSAATFDGELYSLDAELSLRGMTSGAAGVADVGGTGAWVTTYAIGRNHPALRHVAFDGRPLDDMVELPEGSSLRAAYRGGLVLTGDDAASVTLWDPARRKVLHNARGVQLADATARRLVWAAPCEGRCEMTWFDLPNDFDGVGICRCGAFEVPGAFSWITAELSPDGRLIALQTGSDAGTRITVCRVDPGGCETPRTAAEDVADLEWTVDGTTLLMTSGTGRLAAWRSGWDELRLLPGEHQAERVVALGAS